MFEGYAEYLANEKVLLTNTYAFPSHHKFPDHPSVVASLLTVELDVEVLAFYLVECHVEGTLPRDEDTLPVDALVDLWHFEHKGCLQSYLFVFVGKVRDK